MLGSKTNVVNRVLIVVGTIGVSLGWVCASDEPLIQSEVELVSLVQSEDEIEAISSIFLSQKAGTIGVGELGIVLLLRPDLKKQIELSDWPTMNPYAKYNVASLGLGRIWSDDDNPKSKNVISELDVSLSELSGKQTEFFDRRLEFGAAILLRHAYIVEVMHLVELESIKRARNNSAEISLEKLDDRAQCFKNVSQYQHQCSLESEFQFSTALKDCAVLVQGSNGVMSPESLCGEVMALELTSNIKKCIQGVFSGYADCGSNIHKIQSMTANLR